MMMMIDVDTKNGGMQLNNDFLVDFGDEPGGPVCGSNGQVHSLTKIQAFSLAVAASNRNFA